MKPVLARVAALPEWVRCALILVVSLNVVFFPYIWQGKTLMSAAADSASLYISGAEPAEPIRMQTPRVIDPGAAAWQTEPGFALIHHQLFVEHHLPLWNPSVGYGEPLAANMISQPYYPLSIIPVVFTNDVAYNYWVLARFLTAGMGAFLFLRLLVDFRSATIGALAFMYTGYFLSYYDIAHLSVEVLIPWTFFAAEHIVRRPGYASIVLLAAVDYLVYVGGMPESAMLVLTFSLAYTLFRVVVDRECRARWRPIALSFAVGSIAGAALAAFLLIPFLEYLARSHNDHQVAFTNGAKAGNQYDAVGLSWATYFVPLIFGPPWSNILNGFNGFSGARGFFGVPVAFFAFLAVIAFAFERKRGLPAWTSQVGFFLGAALYFVGKRYGNPLVEWTGNLPAYSLIQFTKYDEPLLGFAMACLAAFGVARVLERSSSAALRWSSAVACLLVLSEAWLQTRDLVSATTPFVGFYTRSMIFALLLLAAVALAAVFAVRRDKRSAYAGWMALVVFVVAAPGVGYVVPMHYGFNDPAPDRADPYRGAAYVSFLQSATATDRWRFFGEDGMLFPDWADAFDLLDVRDLDALYDRRYLPFIRAYLPHPQPDGDRDDRFIGTEQLTFYGAIAQRFLAVSSVRYIATAHPLLDLSFFGPALTENLDRIPPADRIAYEIGRFRLGGETREGLLQHPPSRRLGMRIVVPRGARALRFGIGLRPEVYEHGVTCGGAVGFTLEAESATGAIALLMHRDIDPKHIIAQRRWIDITVPMQAYAGRTIRLLLSTDGGPANDTCAAWAVWGGGTWIGANAPGHPPDPRPLHLVYAHEQDSIYRFEHALPRIALYGDVQVAGDSDAALALLTAPRFDPRSQAVISPERPGDAALVAGLHVREPLIAATLKSYDSQDATAEYTSGDERLAVFNDTYFPGWNAYVDGKAVPILRANSLFRGVVVPPGHHTIAFRYEPASLHIGLSISGVTLAALAGFGFLRRKKRNIEPLNGASRAE